METAITRSETGAFMRWCGLNHRIKLTKPQPRQGQSRLICPEVAPTVPAELSYTQAMDSTDPYEISTETDRLDVGLIHEFLRSSYWARNIPRAVVEKSLRNSLCFGAFLEGRQVGFGRVITD